MIKKIIFGLLITGGLLTLGLTNLQAEWNPFSKKWYEDCESDIMIKNYTKNFELMFDRKYGKGSTNIMVPRNQSI